MHNISWTILHCEVRVILEAVAPKLTSQAEKFQPYKFLLRGPSLYSEDHRAIILARLCVASQSRFCSQLRIDSIQEPLPAGLRILKKGAQPQIV